MAFVMAMLVWLGITGVMVKAVSDPGACSEAYECCLHPYLSTAFNDCCDVHGCCPRSCDQFIKDKGSSLGYCVEDNGIIRIDRSSWYTSECRQCVCEAGVITCHTLTNICPPPPHRTCEPVPARCCQEWKCSRTCVDEVGVVHEVGDMWISPVDPCANVWCTEQGPVIAIKVCDQPPPPPHQGCTLERPPGQCCHVWICRTCVDEIGVVHEVGDSWISPVNPCAHVRCTEQGPITALQDCARPPPPPHQGCTLERPPGQCCPVWICSGCVDYFGVHHEEGETWRHQCTNYMCIFNVIRELPIDCPTLPQRPHIGCSRITVDCCPQWNCVGCVDDLGVHHDESETWRLHCRDYMCTLGNIIDITGDCPTLPQRPYIGCSRITVDCCPQWNCNGCVDSDGILQPAGHTWTDPHDPCRHHHCDGTVIQTYYDCIAVPCPDPYSRVCVHYRDQCHSDFDCYEDRHCCLVAGCGRECIPKTG